MQKLTAAITATKVAHSWCDVIKWKQNRVTGPLWGKSTGPRWISLTKASDAELRCFPWSPPDTLIIVIIASTNLDGNVATHYWDQYVSLRKWLKCAFLKKLHEDKVVDPCNYRSGSMVNRITSRSNNSCVTRATCWSEICSANTRDWTM